MRSNTLLHIICVSLVLSACGSSVDFMDDDASTSDAPGDGGALDDVHPVLVPIDGHHELHLDGPR